MATRIFYTSNGVVQEVSGSDGRLNTSSRSSQRIHYISRDDGQAYSVTSHDATGAAGTYPIYLQNTASDGKLLYVDKVMAGGVETTLWKVWFVTGTASGSSELTATNWNKASNNTASITARGDGPVSDLTADGEIWTFRTDANDHDEVGFDDAVILGQNDAVAVEIDVDDASPGIVEVSISFYLETSE